jgi:hypothetical protein
MNAALVFFVLAMALTLSHLWQRSVRLLASVSLLWIAFLMSFVLPLLEEGTWQQVVLKLIEIAAVASLLVGFLIIKYVERAPIWRPPSWRRFVEKVEQSGSTGLISLVRGLGAFFIIGLLVSVAGRLLAE